MFETNNRFWTFLFSTEASNVSQAEGLYVMYERWGGSPPPALGYGQGLRISCLETLPTSYLYKRVFIYIGYKETSKLEKITLCLYNNHTNMSYGVVYLCLFVSQSLQIYSTDWVNVFSAKYQNKTVGKFNI